MRLLISCMKCVDQAGAPNGQPVRVEFRDDGKYELTCSNGHETTTILQQQKFEVLFDIGAHAILDGYYREAVSSFAASLERFYEFAIRVFLHKAETPSDAITSCWKVVSSQSERQIGAFVFLWVSCFHTAPKLLDQKQVSFRNDVVHKGKIPSQDEAIAFGNAVLDVLRPNMLQLRSQLNDSVQQIVFQHLRSAYPKDMQQPPTTLCAATIVSLSAEISHQQPDLRHHLDALKAWRPLLYGREV